jgi:nucleotidyltransferase substrate binding protein (TIGR01987 family)
LATALPKFSEGIQSVVEGGDARAAARAYRLGAAGIDSGVRVPHELAWNTLKDFLESRGRSNIFGSKDATREGFAAGLSEDGDAWMQMIENRNETTHTYDEETADEIGEAILSSYVPQFEKFRTRFMQLEREEET